MISKNNSFDLQNKARDAQRYAFTFIALFVVLIIIYGNSFHNEWHLDDYGNIVNNPGVHLKSLSWNHIKKVFPKRLCGRLLPLSFGTFALNYYFSGTSVFGYHVVNFFIHYIASLFLFLLIYNTLLLPRLSRQYQRTAYPIALLCVFLWSTHPIQVSAVTYIVQRIASMAGMFYIMAMYFYVMGRLTVATGKRCVYFVFCLVCAAFALGSKETAAMLPVSIFLYDLFLIQGISKESIKKNLIIMLFSLLFVMLAAVAYTDIASLLNGYKYRPFTMAERLLTEPRVILFYISLLLYPASSRLNLLHDFGVSRSLLAPWTTLLAVLLILFLITGAIIASRKAPLIAYSIVFFFINHIIEGSIIPLELVFEHRNYLPSAFVFVPVAIVWVYLLEYFAYQKSIRFCIILCLTFLLAAHGHTTFLRNGIFKTNISLWLDNIEKAENLHRPHHNLSKALLAAGYNDAGLKEMEKALAGKAGARKTQKVASHFNMGLFFLEQNQYDKSLDQFLKLLEILPDDPKVYQRIAMVLLAKGDLDQAEKYTLKALALAPDAPELSQTLNLILAKKREMESVPGN